MAFGITPSKKRYNTLDHAYGYDILDCNI